MNRKNVWTIVLCAGLLMAVYAGAQEAKPSDPKKEEIKELQGQIREMKKQLGEAGKRLNLAKDETLTSLKKAIADANAAYKEAYTAKLKADPQGAEAMDKIAAIEAKIKELTKKPPKPKKEKKGGR